MCGIAGIISPKKNVSKAVTDNVIESLKHRGPDGQGTYFNENNDCVLIHTRLAIVDLSERGRQPMANDKGNLILTFNGEIYNHDELRKSLQEKGYSFNSTSDTEVLLKCYQEYGADCLEKLNGMFAFAIHNKEKNEVFLARDRFGIKPLYYSFNQETKRFSFASEIKALYCQPDFQKDIDYKAVGDFFKYRYIPAPRTIWKSVRKLRPAHFAVLDINTMGLTIHQYYSLLERIDQPSTLKDVESLYNDAVQIRLQSDVEAGIFLSGGMDSSAVASKAILLQEGTQAFTIGFTPEDKSELPTAKKIATALKLKHTHETVADCDPELLQKLWYQYDEPLADSSCIPTMMVSKLASNSVKVILSGDGGDEVFSGYNWYRSALPWWSGNEVSLDKIEDKYNKLLLNRFTPELFNKLFVSTEIADKINNDRPLFPNYYKQELKASRRLQFLDMNTFLADDILPKVDRASMAYSLEVRIPFLDHRLVEAVFSLNEADFPSDSVGKPILKNILKTTIPKSILDLPKKGFSAPITNWNFYKKISESLKTGQTIKDGIFNEKFINDLIDNKYHNSEAMLWMIFVFECWYQKWMKEV